VESAFVAFDAVLDVVLVEGFVDDLAAPLLPVSFATDVADVLVVVVEALLVVAGAVADLVVVVDALVVVVEDLVVVAPLVLVAAAFVLVLVVSCFVPWALAVAATAHVSARATQRMRIILPPIVGDPASGPPIRWRAQ
jgi:hypothetical protein